MGSAPAKIGDLMASGNVYWCTSGLRGKPFYGADWLGWQALGKDSGSVIADPLFKNARSGDWRLKEGSPAIACGFVPFDWTRAGVDRRDSRWAGIADETTWTEPESVVKPPSYASLPMACDFNRFPIGKYVTDASCQILKPISGVPGSFWIVADREAGRRVLKIVDQSAEKQSWCPHLSTKGCYRDCKLSIAFSICLGKGAQVECAFRDDSCGGGRPYATGGEFTIGGNIVPEGRWTDVRFDLDLKERRWGVRSKPRGGEATEGDRREVGDIGFRNLTWFGFMSTGAAGSEWRLAGLRIKREDR